MEDKAAADGSPRRGSSAPSREAAGKMQTVAGRYLNRELSMLDYHTRVLARAEDRSLPLLERMRFVGHFAAGLDDFFQIRVAGLKEQQEAAPAHQSPDGRTPGEQLAEIRQHVDALVERQTRLFDELLEGLAEAGCRVVSVSDLSKRDLQQVERYYNQNVFPVLTPLAVDPGHPFPYISHFSLNLGVVIRDPLLRLERFARIKVPPLLPRYMSVSGDRFVAIEEVIANNLSSLFAGMEIVSHGLFRVTRDNDLEVREAEADDLLLAIQSELRRHRRRANAVRLEVNPDVPADVLDLLVRELELKPEDVHHEKGTLDLATAANFLADLDQPQLKLRTQASGSASQLAPYENRPADLFAALQKADVLVHHPYESFGSSVAAFVAGAAADPNVLAIKQTLYRTSGPASPIALALIRAAQAGKQVVALVELKARGDEQANIAWAQALEDAGVHVVYGLVGLKTHAKVILVVRQETDGIRRYVHVATGNYNPNTAKAYEDVGLFSADDELGSDASQLFNFLTGYSRQRSYAKLLVAPMNLRSNLLRLIRQEAGESDGRIIMKINSLEDTEIADALYEASQAGAEIDLIARGMCVLRPGVPGLSERIRVRSLVGHFLEHSRIFRFGSDRRGPRYYIGSADMMERNLDRRVEAVAPILDPALQAGLAEVLTIELADDVLSWTLDSKGEWHKVETKKHVNSQEQLAALAQERARVLDSEALLA